MTQVAVNRCAAPEASVSLSSPFGTGVTEIREWHSGPEPHWATVGLCCGGGEASVRLGTPHPHSSP